MMFHLSSSIELTPQILLEFIDKHKQEVASRYENLYKAYTSDHDILYEKEKASYKPDNRIVVNFPKYIVDTMNGFFIGNPIKITAVDEVVADYVEYLDQYNDQDDNNAELSKISSIYGKGSEFYFADEKSELNITYFNPMEAFMIFDDSVLEKPLHYVRLYKDNDGNEFGCVSNKVYNRKFKLTGGFAWLDEGIEHGFDDVPATEFIENEERQGIFEPVMSMVNAFNKAVSEKANDVDYFADAYLKILGTKLDNDDIKHIRDNRIINFEGDVDTGKLIVEFMNKPESDTTQENHLNRLERLIFQISMVANISDENFGSSTGIALKYKLQAMSNLEKTKRRKFTSGMNRRYKILFSHPLSKVPADAWVQLHYHFTPNFPANLLEEVEIAAKMEGITSHQTQLKVISAVDDVQGELDKIEEENKPPEMSPVEKVMFGAVANNATTEEGLTDEQ
jgi:SPP1 family phage portal protein